MILHRDKAQKTVLQFFLVLVLAMLIYATIGLGFHLVWKHELDECRQARIARGEFVEPEVFSPVLALLFNATHWPVYAWANWYHFGIVLATPCSRSRQ